MRVWRYRARRKPHSGTTATTSSIVAMVVLRSFMQRETIRRLSICWAGRLRPVARPEPWLTCVNGAVEERDATDPTERHWGAPFGSEGWMPRTAALLGLDASHPPIGRSQRLVEM
jgi:hypothetical protein